ncbi:MAG: hypothetical protein HQL53_14100 [Magnetococcales bacterium]|nr:hypothetical protein [Magnetococcales bacterium]
MPVILPTSLEDCITFIEENRADIEAGTYDIKIDPSWMRQLPQEAAALILTHCNAAKLIAAQAVGSSNREQAMLAQLAEDDDEAIRKAAASNPHTPTATLEMLSGDFFEAVRLAVAQNPSTPENTLDQLAQEKNSQVRRAVAQNPEVSLAIFNRLARDRAQGVRDAVAQLASTTDTPAALDHLPKCAQPEVRQAVCANPNLPWRALTILWRDNAAIVKQAAQTRFIEMAASPKSDSKLLAALADLGDLEILRALAKNRALPAPLIPPLMQHPDERIGLSLAANPALNDAALMQMANNDERSTVRNTLAQRVGLPESVLAQLSENPSPSLQAILSRNPTEQMRRKTQQLCLTCGAPLSGLGKTISTRCFRCVGRSFGVG